MARIRIGDMGGDMRLEDDFYGNSAMQKMGTFLDNFTPVREQVLVHTYTTFKMRKWDSLDRAVTWTLSGNLSTLTLHTMTVKAQGIQVSFGGNLQIDPDSGTITGWVTSELAEVTATNTLLVSFTKIRQYASPASDHEPDVTMLAGPDWITSGRGDDFLLGYAGADLLESGGGADTLNGGTGNDTMKGGAGRDTYLVDAAGDRVVEGPGAGTDTVLATVSHVLGQNVENLTLTGSLAIAGSGNDGNNAITGNANGNRIDGRAGADTMRGGAGDDTYVVDNLGDVVIEQAGQGSDTVRSTASCTLRANVENLLLTGTLAISGLGNDLGNTLMGNNEANRLVGYAGNDTLGGGGGNDTLAGGVGRDILTGALGADTFLFDTVPVTSEADTITDFVPGQDTIALARAIFTAIGGLGDMVAGDERFYAAPGANAGHDGNDRLVYDSTSGSLFYDADGSGPTAAVRIAILGAATHHPPLVASDILVQG